MKRAIVHILRFAVCAVALWWALRGLSWHDWITLPDGQRRQVLEIRDDSITIIRNDVGTRRILPIDDVPRDAEGDLLVEYGVPTVWRHSTKSLIGLSLLLFAPVPLLGSLRFVLMLRAQDIRISIWEGIKLTYAGNFFNFVMIGTTGGDLVKAYYVSRHTRRKIEAVTALLLDRVVGLFGIAALAAVAMTFKLDDPRIRQLLLWVVGMLAGLAVGAILFFLPGLRGRLRPAERFRWLPGLDKIRRIDRATLRLREHPAVLAGTLGLTFALQAIAVGAFYTWSQALGMKPAWPAYYAYIGVSLVVAAIPVSPMGLGTMEAALMLFLHPQTGFQFGSKNQVAFLALGIRLIMLVWALPGVLVPMTGAHRPSPQRLAELEADIAAEEREGQC